MPISPAELLNAQMARPSADEQLLKVASACEGYGVELALLKVAEMETKEENEDSEEDKKEDLSEEEKKEASAMGLYTLEGFIAKLAAAGETMYGDPSVYIRALAEQNGSYEKVATAKETFMKGWDAAKGYATRAGKATSEFASDVGSHIADPRRMTNAKFLAGRGEGYRHAVRATAAGLPGAAVGAAGGAAIDDDNRLRGALIGAGLGGAAGAAGGAYAPSIKSKAYDPASAWLKERFAKKAPAAAPAKAKPKAKK
jgi:hypothetical protein